MFPICAFYQDRAAPEQELVVQRSPAWLIAALVVGISYIVLLERGIQFAH
jgi:hypothetical protein